MKKLIEKVNWKNILFLIVVVAVALLVFRKCFDDDNPILVTDLPTMNEVKELNQIKAKNGGVFAEMQVQPTKTIATSGIPREKYDSILNELNVKEKQVVALTLFSGTIKDSLKLTKIEVDEMKNKVWKWEKTLTSGSKIVREMSEKDSVLHESSDIRVAVVDRVEGRGKNTKFFTDFFPLDDNFKFNGASIYRTEKKEIHDILQVDINTEFQKSFLTPNARVISDLQLSILPDGKFVPSLKVGGVYDIQNGLDWFYGVRLKHNLFRIKKSN